MTHLGCVTDRIKYPCPWFVVRSDEIIDPACIFHVRSNGIIDPNLQFQDPLRSQTHHSDPLRSQIHQSDPTKCLVCTYLPRPSIIRYSYSLADQLDQSVQKIPVSSINFEGLTWPLRSPINRDTLAFFSEALAVSRAEPLGGGGLSDTLSHQKL